MDKPNSLIGLDAEIAKQILIEQTGKKINIINNSTGNADCDRLLVVNVRESADEITLVCGEFLSQIKE